jgi:hypothetical protein
MPTISRSALLVTAVFAGAAIAATPASADRRPDVRLLDRSPVKIVGRAFAVRERVTVRVIVAGGPRFSTVARTGAAGRFTAAFPERTIPECAGFGITAVGTKGSRATLRRVAIPPPCGVEPQP